MIQKTKCKEGFDSESSPMAQYDEMTVQQTHKMKLASDGNAQRD